MGEDIHKKILIEVEYRNAEAKAAVNKFKDGFKALDSAIEASNTKIVEAKERAAEYAAELAKSKLDVQKMRQAEAESTQATREANEAIRQAKKNHKDAAGSYDEAQKKLTALGRAIKSAEGGFKSTSPAIRAQIKEYKELNDKLKAFDEQMGNHQRKVGQYENALNGLEGILSKLIPNFDKISGAVSGASQAIGFMTSWTKKAEGGITSMAKSGSNAGGIFNKFSGFKQFNSGAEQAVETTAKAEKGITSVATSAAQAAPAVEGLGESAAGASGGIAEAGAATGGMALAIAAVIAIGAGLISYFAKLTPNADSLAQRWAYMKGLFRGFMDDIGQGVGFGKLADDMAKTAQEAANLTLELQNLHRAQTVDEIDDAKIDAQIAELQLKMRNRRNTPEQEKAYFDQIQKIAEDKYKGNKELADKEYELAVRQAVNSQRFSEEEKKRLMKDGIDYAVILDKTKGLVNGEDDLKAIVEAQQKQIATSREREMIEERAQNRLDAIDMRAEAAAERAKEKADRLRQQMEHDLAEAKRGMEEAVNERKASMVRVLQSDMDTLARELSIAEEGNRQKLFKEQEFQSKMAELAARTKSPKAKSKFLQAIEASKKNEIQAQVELSAAKLKIIEDYNQKSSAEVLKGDLDIKRIINESQDNELKQRIESEDLTLQATIDGLNEQKLALEKSIRQNTETLTTAKGNDRIVIQQALDRENVLLKINNAKQEAETKSSEKRKAKIKRDAAQADLMAQDQADVLASKRKDGTITDKEFAAEKKEITDRYEFEIAEAARAGKSTVLLKQEELEAIKALERQYQLQKYDQAVRYEKILQDNISSIVSNSIQHQAQATQVMLDKAKAAELKNTALTGTQKEIIEEKYRVKAGQAKVKEFKANQKLQIANALINLMVAEGRLWVDPGFPAAIPLAVELGVQGAAQIATIAAQKPPAYATGGLHYKSDGKGSLLNGPGTGTSDSMNARLSNGEAIINAKSTALFAPILSAINQAGGGRPFSTTKSKSLPWFAPGFATGGTFNTYLPTADNGLRPIPISQSGPMRLHPEDIASIGNHIGNNFPTAIVDVKDINNQQDILANNKARVII